MKDIDDIRRDNLRIIERELGGPSGAARTIGMSPAQFTNLRDGAKDSKTGKPRGMRKETARKIEERCHKPVGWLDLSHNNDAPSSLTSRQHALLDLFEGLTAEQQEAEIRRLTDQKQENDAMLDALLKRKKA